MPEYSYVQDPELAADSVSRFRALAFYSATHHKLVLWAGLEPTSLRY